ncbi:general substrate transporter [Suillus paluster]|uniref:general substrate transporter n=1 Tax=Suillus paluster TaxID=48578 RepID=UPI001B86DD3C|nr:general substrate transporter [Suillus paluster]KAG1737835.1 general substrate transporter [Suillus paluster]
MTHHGYVTLPSNETEDVSEGVDLILESLLEDKKGVTLDTPHGGSLIVHEDGHTYNYSYGPSGIPGLVRNRYAVACAAFAGIGGISFGYDQGVIANVLVMKDFLARWPIGPWEKGLMTAVLELGALFGAIASGILADKYSRRHSIFFASIIFCIGSGLQCGAQSLNDLIIGRAIGGFGVGALSMLAPLYIAEISPPELRGSLMALEQLAIVLGVVCGFWTGFFTRNMAGSASWRIPLALQFLPGISLCLGCFVLPPSPRLLVLRDRIDDARKSLAKLRLRTPDEAKKDPLIQLELLEMRINVALIQHGMNSKNGLSRESWTTLFGREYVRRTLIGVMIMFFQQWSGINALLYYGPTLVESIGMRGDTVTLLVSGGIGIVQFLAVIPAIILLDRWGRKPLLKGGSAIMSVSHFLIAILIYLFQDDWGSNTIAAWVAVFCTYTFTAAYGMSLGPIGWVLPSEVFPLSMRSKGVSVSTASNWINNFLIGLITPPLMEISSAATFMIFACACFGAYLWSTYVVPETAGVSLEEMDAVFGSEAGQEDCKRKFELERELGLHSLIKSLVTSDALA